MHYFKIKLIGHGEFLNFGDKGKGGIASAFKIKKKLHDWQEVSGEDLEKRLIG